MKHGSITTLAIVAALGCGQTAQDPASAGGTAGAGATGGAGSGGMAGTSGIECAGKHWTRLAVPPGGTFREYHGAAPWRGDQVLIWGGGAPDGALGTGWRVFSNGTVSALPAAGAPSPRAAHTLDVLADRLLVFGGSDYGSAPLNDGYSLDLETSVWSPLPNPGALLPPRHFPLSGAAGSRRWLVWGGLNPELAGILSDGALFDLETESWMPLTGNAPLPTSLSESRALARGGAAVGPAVFGFGKKSNAPGYGYTPTVDDWWEMPTGDAPAPRSGATLTWSPVTSELIAWGGHDGTNARDDGARFSTKAGTWKAMTIANAPAARSGHYAVVLGTKLVIWGGLQGLTHVSTGGVYDVVTDSWGPLPSGECAPLPRRGATFTAFGDGKRALLWGGQPEPETDGPPVDQGWLLEL